MFNFVIVVLYINTRLCRFVLISINNIKKINTNVFENKLSFFLVKINVLLLDTEYFIL